MSQDTDTILDHPIDVSDRTFDDEVLGSDLPVLVDFWAPWCGPCKMVAPVLEEIARTHAGRLKIVKVNTQQYQQVSQKMGVRSIPTMVIFRDGEVADVQIGALPQVRLEKWIAHTIEPKPSLWSKIFGGASAEA
jgi:thioredoxin 1